MMEQTRRRFLHQMAGFGMLSAGLLANARSVTPPTVLNELSVTTRIWDTGANKPISSDQLMRQLSAATFILLGETHDNRTHHAIQAGILRALLAAGRRPALAMEQFDTGQQTDISTILASSLPSGEKLQRLLAAMDASWDKAAYADILQVGLDAALPLVAANLSRSSAREVAQQGFSPLGKTSGQDLMLDAVWDDAKEQETRHAIQEGHCGMLPDRAVQGMVRAQRARDAIMADRLLQHARSGVVAVVGRGHVLKTTAMPLYLLAREPELKTIAIGLLEAPDMKDPPLPDRRLLAAQYDYAWMTPAEEGNADPCAVFRGEGESKQLPR